MALKRRLGRPCAMRSSVVGGLVLGLAVVGCSAPRTYEEEMAVPETRTIEAVRADEPPLIDGKLDDACWRRSKPVSDFLTYRTDRLATMQTVGYVCYDDSHLYIGVKCLMPKGAWPVGELRPHDTYLFSDDVVEIFLNPGRRHADYYQFVINAYGSTFDTLRQKGGGHDPSWDVDWKGGAYIADGYWSAELAVPFYSLGITPDVGSTWGINLCRYARSPQDELSSIGTRGVFSDATGFAALEGLDADFSRYLFAIGPAVTRLVPGPGRPHATFVLPVSNLTGKRKVPSIARKEKKELLASLGHGLAKDRITENLEPKGQIPRMMAPLAKTLTDADKDAVATWVSACPKEGCP